MSRRDAIAAAQGIANDRAVAAGAARKTISIIESEDMPLAYLPGNSVRVRVRVVGDVAAS
jgi:N-methylhydantoinase A/oxoprolinase/acetone carboxylase beta subunit